MTWQQAFKEDPTLFEGCSKVFLDVGSNRGTHVRKLFEPEKYSGAPYLRMFDEGFGEARSGPSSETGICTFAFEANPRWTSRLQEIEKAYAAKGWRAKWFAPTAVSDSSSNLTFYLNDQAGASSDWGASMVKEHEWSKAVQVPAIDLSGFMEELAAHASPGYRLMKMDIESAEFLVLPTFLDKNLLCKNVLDKLTIEWHVETLPTLDEQNKARETKNKVEGDASVLVVQQPSWKILTMSHFWKMASPCLEARPLLNDR
jgi:FkbM family methyltransferase